MKESGIPIKDWFQKIQKSLNLDIKNFILNSSRFDLKRIEKISSNQEWIERFGNEFISEFTGIRPISQRVMELIEVQSRDVFNIQGYCDMFRETQLRLLMRDDDMLAIFLFLNALPKELKLKLDPKVSEMVYLGRLSLNSIMEMAAKLDNPNYMDNSSDVQIIDASIQQTMPDIEIIESKNQFTTASVIFPTTPSTPPRNLLVAKIKPSTPKAAPKLAKKSKSDSDWVYSSLTIENHLEILENESKNCNFTASSGFPTKVKECFVDCVNAALDVGIYEKTFFEHLAQILPPTAYILRKFAVQLVYPTRISRIRKELGKLYTKFQLTVKREHRPGVKLHWTEELKVLLWNILSMEWEIALLDNITREVFQLPQTNHEITVRKTTYQKVHLINKLCQMCPQQLEVAMLSSQYSNFRQKRETSENVLEASPVGVIRANLFTKRKRGETNEEDVKRRKD